MLELRAKRVTAPWGSPNTRRKRHPITLLSLVQLRLLSLLHFENFVMDNTTRFIITKSISVTLSTSRVDALNDGLVGLVNFGNTCYINPATNDDRSMEEEVAAEVNNSRR